MASPQSQTRGTRSRPISRDNSSSSSRAGFIAFLGGAILSINGTAARVKFTKQDHRNTKGSANMTSTEVVRQRFLDFRRRLYEEHDLTAVDVYIHPEFTSYSPLIKGRGRAAYKVFVQILHRGVPNLRPVTQHVVVEPEFIMAMTEWVGTHGGPFLGAPATGATLQFKTADRYQIRDGLFFEHWDVVDRLEASLAMGLIRPASSAANARVD
ncbi:ester cyclase [Bradyrhizobium sp. LA6.7]|uniref:ester cyclase n=1 Tax=unclassified Bradyrhizobium TaxID=2631580 RepID=UPI00339B96D7